MGRFVVMAKAQFDLTSESGPTVECTLTVGGVAVDQSAVSLVGPAVATLPLSGVADLSAAPLGGDAFLSCQADSVFASRVKLTAIQVDSITP
jgi:hypothetical protein